MPQRKPRDLDAYAPAEDVARALEEQARHIRKVRGLVKFSVQFWFYNAPPVRMREEHSSSPPLVADV